MSKGGYNKRHHGPPKGGLTSARGFSCVLATCDGAREREASKELSNLLTQALESFPFDTAADNDAISSSLNPDSSTTNDIQAELAREIAHLKKQNGASAQLLSTINTEIKGVVLIKINRTNVCAQELVYSIFDRVRIEKLPCSRHVIRVIPLQKVFYPNDEELRENVKVLIEKELNIISNPVVPVAPIQSTSASAMPVQVEVSSAVATAQLPSAETSVEVFPPVYNNLSSDTRERAVEEDNEDESRSKRICVREGDSAPVGQLGEAGEVDTPSVTHSSVPAPITVTEQPIIGSGASSADTAGDGLAKQPTAASASPSESVSVNPVPTPTPLASFLYTVNFKRRNHNVLQRMSVQQLVTSCMPRWARVNNTKPQGVFLVDVMRNICGVTLSRRYTELLEFNLRKYQQLVAGAGLSAASSGGGGGVGVGVVVAGSGDAETPRPLVEGRDADVPECDAVEEDHDLDDDDDD